MESQRKYRLNEFLQKIGWAYGRETKAFLVKRICDRLLVSEASLRSWRYATHEFNHYRGTDLSEERLQVIAEELNEYLPTDEQVTADSLHNTLKV